MLNVDMDIWSRCITYICLKMYIVVWCLFVYTQWAIGIMHSDSLHSRRNSDTGQIPFKRQQVKLNVIDQTPLCRTVVKWDGWRCIQRNPQENCRRHSQWGDCFTYDMVTSSNGNICRVTGQLCGEFTGHRWIRHTKASDAEFWCFLWSAPE